MLERELFEFLDSTSDAAYTVNERGLICSWNHAAEGFFGYAAREVIDKPCAQLFKGRDALGTPVCAEQCAVLDSALHGREIGNYDVEVQTKSGKRVWANISILVWIDKRTNRRLVVHLARDIGKRKARDDLAQRLVAVARQISSLQGESEQLAPVMPLTPQERKVLRLLAEGKAPAAAARDLNIAPHTLRNHLHHVNLKLHTRNRLEAVVKATRHRLI